MNNIPSSRTSYDTFLISLYMHGKEHLIPEALRDNIPPSTISGFRNRNPRHYFGHELREMQKDMLDHHELILQHARLKKILAIVTSVWLSFAKAGAHALLKKKHMRPWVVDNVQRLATVLSKPIVLRLAGLSISAFAYRLNEVKFQCGVSPLRLCRKRHPLQLAISEVKKLEALMTDSSMSH
jgi:putative transposase